MADDPDVRHSSVEVPYDMRMDIPAVIAAAERQAQNIVSEDERVVDIQLGTGRPKRGEEDVFFYPFSFQILRPGGSVTVRCR